MLNLEKELLAAGAPPQLIAIERREVVSVYTELRVLAWLGVMLIVTGVGVVVSKNLQRIGPVTIAAAIGLASAGCYAYAIRRRGHTLSDYILLLGALLLSADIGYIESQFHLLGAGWPRHFLLLAVIHGLSAYYFSSRALLSLSIAALASWLGIERNIDNFFSDSVDMAARAFVCAGTLVAWRFANRRRDFHLVFDHAIANLALWGGLILTFSDGTRATGALIVIVLAALTIVYGFRKREEAFIIYAFIYAVIAVDFLIVDLLFTREETFAFFYILVSTVAAIIGLFVLHARFKRVTE